MRVIIRSREFDAFYNSLTPGVQSKIDYAISVMTEITVLSAKLVKRLVGTDFYELRISVGNEYRVVMFTIDHENIIEARQIFLLNGFVKKSTKDYKKQIDIAVKIIKTLE